MNDLNKDIKIVEEMINEAQCEALSYDKYCYEIKVQQVEAIENLLSRLKTAERMNDVLADELDIITDKIAMKIGTDDFEFCDERCHNEDECGECKQCIKEWARKKVEDE